MRRTRGPTSPRSRTRAPHGEAFEYRSILTDLLGWLLERVGGVPYADLVSRELWSRIGAEQDAEITVDRHGCALADGGMSASLRDLGRFGQMILEGGRVGGEQIVPAAVDRGRTARR